jgi:hypothetical protein
MGWVRRADTTAAHRCVPPTVGAASIGDLWECADCWTLWRIGPACDACDSYGPDAHPGFHSVGYAWRPATWTQRLRRTLQRWWRTE